MHRLPLLLLLAAAPASGEISLFDSLTGTLAVAARNYDRERIAALVVQLRATTPEPTHRRDHSLLMGLALWRLQLIAFCQDDRAGIEQYGTEALRELTASEMVGAEPYITASHKALVCQLLAAMGLRKATTYGPRSAAELAKARQARPGGYFVGFIEATNAIGAPAFAGGNPRRAWSMLDSLGRTYPDSVDIEIQKARALIRMGEKERARTQVQRVLRTAPGNLLARRVARDAL